MHSMSTKERQDMNAVCGMRRGWGAGLVGDALYSRGLPAWRLAKVCALYPLNDKGR